MYNLSKDSIKNFPNKNNELFKTEVISKCLTDNCSDCTGGYVNRILRSRLVCRCVCHERNQPVNQTSLDSLTRKRLEISKSNNKE
jgi:hypothetical protein